MDKQLSGVIGASYVKERMADSVFCRIGENADQNFCKTLGKDNVSTYKCPQWNGLIGVQKSFAAH